MVAAARPPAVRAARAPAALEVPEDVAIVEAAVNAAESVIFSRYDRSEIRDLDIGIEFTVERLEIDIYLDIPEGGESAEQVADDAAMAALDAVDERLEG